MPAINGSTMSQVKTFFTNNSIINKISAFFSKLVGVKNSETTPCSLLKMNMSDTEQSSSSTGAGSQGFKNALQQVTVEDKNTNATVTKGAENKSQPVLVMSNNQETASVETEVKEPAVKASHVESMPQPAENKGTPIADTAKTSSSSVSMKSSSTIPTPPPLPSMGSSSPIPPPPPMPMPTFEAPVKQTWSSISTTPKSEETTKSFKPLVNNDNKTTGLIDALVTSKMFEAAQHKYGGDKYAATPLSKDDLELLYSKKANSESNLPSGIPRFVSAKNFENNELFQLQQAKNADTKVSVSDQTVQLPPSQNVKNMMKKREQEKKLTNDVKNIRDAMNAQLKEVLAIRLEEIESLPDNNQ